MKTKFILFGLMVLLPISFISCQKNDEIKYEAKTELITTFSEAISQYADEYYQSEVPNTKSMDNEYISLMDAGEKLPLEVQGYIRQAIGRAANNDSIASIVFGWAFGTATGGPAGGVYGAIGAMLWELL